MAAAGELPTTIRPGFRSTSRDHTKPDVWRLCLRSYYRGEPAFDTQFKMANGRIRVAVVDDDESIRRALKRLLHALAFDTETYGSGREFHEFFHAFRPDCVILDLHMEGMSGLDVQRHLQRMRSRPPVVVITGHDNPGVRAESLSLGADAFLPKPVDRQLLISTIERLTKEARSLS